MRWIAAVMAMAIALATLPAAGIAADEEKPKKEYGKTVGTYMAPFTLPNPVESGKEYKLDSFLGKPTLITFLQSACGLCINEVRELNTLYPGIKDKMNVVAIFLDVDPGRLGKYREAFQIQYLMLHDGDAKVANSVGLTSTPGSLLLDKDGKIVKRHSGYQRDLMKEMTTLP